jgi:hypothetical protein
MNHPTLLPGWGPLVEPPRHRLQTAAAVLRWWWPTAVVAGFLVLVAVVGDRDHPAPGLSMRGLVILTLAAAALTALTVRRRLGPWALARAVAEYAVLVLLVGLLATPTAASLVEPAPARSTQPPAAQQEAEQRAATPPVAKQSTATLPPGISQVVGAGRRLADASHWLLELWRRADQQPRPPVRTPHPRARPNGPDRPPTRRTSLVTRFRHLPIAGRLIIVAVAIGVFAIAVVACATSYNAIYRLVGDLGLYGYRINQLFPLMLDAAFLVAELAAILGGIMRAVTRSDEVSVGWPGTTMLLCGLGTIGFNVAHAYLIGGRGDPLTVWRCVVASLPPGADDLVVPGADRDRQVGHAASGPAPQQRRRSHLHCGLWSGPAARPVRAVPAASGLWAGAQLGAFARQPKRAPGNG